MEQTLSPRWSGRSVIRSVAGAVLIAALLAAIALATLPSRQPAIGASAGATDSGMPVLIGEHSALGARLVDALNAAIAGAGQRATGEHAGLSRTEYEAGAPLDGSGQ